MQSEGCCSWFVCVSLSVCRSYFSETVDLLSQNFMRDFAINTGFKIYGVIYFPVTFYSNIGTTFFWWQSLIKRLTIVQILPGILVNQSIIFFFSSYSSCCFDSLYDYVWCHNTAFIPVHQHTLCVCSRQYRRTRLFLSSHSWSCDCDLKYGYCPFAWSFYWRRRVLQH